MWIKSVGGVLVNSDAIAYIVVREGKCAELHHVVGVLRQPAIEGSPTYTATFSSYILLAEAKAATAKLIADKLFQAMRDGWSTFDVVKSVAPTKRAE